MVKKLLVLTVLAPLTVACASIRAEKPVENPALSVPAPPEKTVEPAPVDPQIPEPVPELPPAPVTPPRPRPQQRESNSAANRDPAKPPDSKPAETAPPTEPPPTAPTVPPLRTPDVISPEQNARQIRDIMIRTSGMLSRIDYRLLTNEQKKAYDDAKQFLDQAEGGLKESNFEFARNVADKAEKLAKALQGR
jgi:hypothetical protein